ncbi:MAG: VOC family protein [Planctomycetes bacterium]|nr:VOC family protein [Planctomycetota bacterium]
MPATKALPKGKQKKKTGAAKAKKAARAKKQKKAKKAPIGAIKRAARVILYVTDFDRAVEFYTRTLGLTLAYPAGGGWAEFRTGDAALCLHAGRDAAMPTKGIASVGLAVDDFDAALARLTAAGVTMSAPFDPCGGLRVSSFSDPDGNELSIEGK